MTSKPREQVILETTPVTPDNIHALLDMLIALQKKRAQKKRRTS